MFSAATMFLAAAMSLAATVDAARSCTLRTPACRSREARARGSRAAEHASCGGVRRGEDMVEPEVRELLLDRVHPEPVLEVLEVHLVENLVLVEAGEDGARLLARHRIDVLLK